MVFRRAMNSLDAETRKHIRVTGMGGETMFIPDDGLGSFQNIAEKQDPVPTFNPINWSRFRNVFDDPNANGGTASHSWEDTYLPHLKKNPSALDDNGDCP